MIAHHAPRFILFVFILLSILVSLPLRTTQSQWSNVPPAPAKERAASFFLGDTQFAYRANSLMLQNLGYGLAKELSFDHYNYNTLKDWFFLQDGLDPLSDTTPLLAAYYYGAVKDKEKMGHVVDYLTHVGQRPIKEKWRWLARAVFLARYELEDMDKALELSYLLARNENPDLADWAKQMPAFVLAGQGKPRAAYEIMLNILISEAEKLHPSELYFIKDYICLELLPKIPEEPVPSFCNSIKK